MLARAIAPSRSDIQIVGRFDRKCAWLVILDDGVYNNAVALVRSSNNSTARYVGSQPQAQLQWNIDRHITFIAIYAHFFAGQFLKETGPYKDVDYFTSWLTYKF